MIVSRLEGLFTTMFSIRNITRLNDNLKEFFYLQTLDTYCEFDERDVNIDVIVNIYT